jgi:hypothetical protein
MARTGRTLQDLAAEIERRADAKHDYVAPNHKLEMIVSEAEDHSGKMVPQLAVTNGQVRQFDMLDLAHGQVGEYLGIPAPYYSRMREQAPHLLADNVNQWLRDKRGERRLVRTLDGRVRAFLSDRYRALENEDLAEAVLPVLLDQNLLILSCEITDRRLYIKAVDRAIERDVPTGRAMGDGTHVFFDTVSPAITISNSEVGYGALAIETGTYTKVCTNLAMIGSNLRKYHTGSRQALSDEVYALLTDETKKATDRAVWMQVRDTVKAAFDLAKFDATIKKLASAAQDRIEPEAAVEVVERAGRRFGFNEGERKGILARLIESADLSRYGLHSAITRHSQEGDIAYDRATELEAIGGDVIELGPNEWREITSEAAVRANRRMAVAA